VSPVPQPQIGFVEAQGAKLHYEVAGEGRPLLLLHAGVRDSRMWDPQWQELSARYRVIRTDLRGYGRTVVLSGQFSYHEDVAALLRHLGEESAFVVGLSFGGRVAIDFALAFPEMVSILSSALRRWAVTNRQRSCSGSPRRKTDCWSRVTSLVRRS